MKEVETDMREAAVRYFEGCLSAQDEERLYRFIQESGGNYSLFKEWERQWLEISVANERTEFEWEKLQARLHTRKAVTPMLLPGVGGFLEEDSCCCGHCCPYCRSNAGNRLYGDMPAA